MRSSDRRIAFPFRRPIDNDFLTVHDQRTGQFPFGVTATELDARRRGFLRRHVTATGEKSEHHDPAENDCQRAITVSHHDLT
jgi:hypothetical protein